MLQKTYGEPLWTRSPAVTFVKISVNTICLYRNALRLLTALVCRLCDPRLLAMADGAQVDGTGGRYAHYVLLYRQKEWQRKSIYEPKRYRIL